MRLLLDTAVLGEVCHPRKYADVRLDELTRELTYVPMATSTWRAAAKVWATLRRGGMVTAAPNALDGDVLIAAQALAEGATVVTPNVRHFEAIVAALAWRDVPLT